MSTLQYDKEGKVDIINLFDGGRLEVLLSISQKLDLTLQEVACLDEDRISRLGRKKGLTLDKVIPIPSLPSQVKNILAAEIITHRMGVVGRYSPGKPSTPQTTPSDRAIHLYVMCRLVDYLTATKE